MPTLSPAPLDAAQAAAYEALVRELKAHPSLRGLVATWRDRRGGTAADDPPTESECPWVRLTPLAQPTEEHTRTTQRRPLLVQVETAVAGQDFPGAARLGAALDHALFDRTDPRSARLRTAVQTAGVSRIVPGSPALPDGEAAYGAALTSGRGSFVLDVYVRLRPAHQP